MSFVVSQRLISKLSGAHDQDRTDDLILTKDVLYQLSYMGAQSIISSKPNTQNDKKPFSSIFSRKPEKLPASVILLYGSDDRKISDWLPSCQQLNPLFWVNFFVQRNGALARPFSSARRFRWRRV